MSINPISEYPEVTELTENDYFPVETPTGLKKVKSSNVGGSGAGDFVVNFAISASSGLSVTGDHTAQEVLTAYNQGKNIKAIASTGDPSQGDVVMTFIMYLGNLSDGGVMFFTFGIESGTIRIDGEVGSNEWDISALS